MKKTNNKGFSLVELIIVIAIMAILAGAIAPALIKYIDKSRKSNDVSAAKTFKTAIETALGTEEVYETLTNTSTYTTIKLIPNQPISSTGNNLSSTYMTITGCSNPNTGADAMDAAAICKAIGSNIGEKTPKTKYQKNINVKGEKDASGFKPMTFCAFITPGGTVYVAVCGNGSGATAPTISNYASGGTPTFSACAPLAPEVCKGYQ